MSIPLKPKATAIWLIENTILTFEQIAEFCSMHPLEVRGMADGEVAIGIIGENPINNGQLTKEMIAACEKDPTRKLMLSEKAEFYLKQFKNKKSKYTPIARRGDKPDAIAWFTKFHPTVPVSDLTKLIGTTKKTILSIRDKTYWNLPKLRPRDPVLLGLCTQGELDRILAKYPESSEQFL
jgi:hypothetical protein